MNQITGPKKVNPYITNQLAGQMGNAQSASYSVYPTSAQIFDAELEKRKAERRKFRHEIATKAMCALLQSPTRPNSEKEIAELAVACADSLLHTLEVTEAITEKIKGTKTQEFQGGISG